MSKLVDTATHRRAGGLTMPFSWVVVKVLTETDGYDTLYLRLPAELRVPIQGGCSCQYCQTHPNEPPTWDTLAVQVRPGATSWTVHAPEWDRLNADRRKAR